METYKIRQGGVVVEKGGVAVVRPLRKRAPFISNQRKEAISFCVPPLLDAICCLRTIRLNWNMPIV